MRNHMKERELAESLAQVQRGRRIIQRPGIHRCVLSVLSKMTITILIIAIFWAILAVLVANSNSLLILTSLVFSVAMSIATGTGWTPLVARLLYIFFIVCCK